MTIDPIVVWGEDAPADVLLPGIPSGQLDGVGAGVAFFAALCTLIFFRWIWIELMLLILAIGALCLDAHMRGNMDPSLGVCTV